MKCSKHPTYEATQAPTADCKECKLIWDITQMSPAEVEAGRQRLESRRVMTSTNFGEIVEGIFDVIGDIIDFD
jgi:hypothetical protein